jgi:hypothetical protein
MATVGTLRASDVQGRVALHGVIVSTAPYTVNAARRAWGVDILARVR